MKILVCDDHALFREGVRHVLAPLDSELVWVECRDGSEVSPLLEQQRDVDLVLLDLAMPGIGGLETLVRIRRSFPAVPVVIVSASEHAADAREALERGASGFISKTSSGPVLRAALQLVLAGGVYVPPDLVGGAAVPAPRAQASEIRRAAYGRLTARQLEVAQLMARGLTNQEIGRVLGIAEGTVKAHLAAIFQALDVDNRTEAAMVLRELES
jgi:DNA-binding NarL/FixJ family response regulator